MEIDIKELTIEEELDIEEIAVLEELDIEEINIQEEFEIEDITIEEELDIGNITIEEDLDIGDMELDVIKEEIVTSDYERLNNLPQINGITLLRNKTSKDLKLQEEMKVLTNLELEEILN